MKLRVFPNVVQDATLLGKTTIKNRAGRNTAVQILVDDNNLRLGHVYSHLQESQQKTQWFKTLYLQKIIHYVIMKVLSGPRHFEVDPWNGNA